MFSRVSYMRAWLGQVLTHQGVPPAFTTSAQPSHLLEKPSYI
jgi:hypothetical protein